MAVISTTLSGVNVFQFSGAVTDAEIGTAFAGTIVNGVYVLNRAIYLDQTCDLTNVTGGFLIDFGAQVLPAIVLDTRRDRTKSVFKNFVFYQRTGLSVTDRNSFVRTWNGTGFANAGSGLSIDGLAQNGGGFFYAVQGVNPAGGTRWLNEMAFAGPMANNTVASQQFALEELQVCMGASTTIKGMTFEKAYGFPQLSPALANANVTVYRSNMNTESLVNGGLIPIRLFPSFNRWASACYVDSYVTRQGADLTTRLVDAFGSTATSRAHFTVLNNYTRGSWFGVSKTNMAITTWGAANTIHGGVLKKLQFIGGAGGVVRCYDSRSTTTSQRCKFAETGFFDFLEDSLSPEVDSEGRIDTISIGAIASGSTAAITRYTDQRRGFYRFGTRVIIVDVDMTSGDNDLSSYTPVILSLQNGMTRTQSQIQGATSINNYRQVLEELHNLAVTQVGESSYDAPFGGNFFELNGRTLTTDFHQVIINPALPTKIAYDVTTNVLSLKSALISSTTEITEWRNAEGTFVLTNATISGVFSDLDGSRVLVSNLDPQNFGVNWNIRYRVVETTTTTTWTELTGTGNTTTIILGLNQYELQARVAGYTWKEIEFDTNVSLSVDLALQYHVADDGSPQYLKPYNATLVDAFEYNDAAMEVEVTNTTGSIVQPGFPELYQVVEKVQQDPTLVWFWVNPVTTNATSQKVLIPPTSPLRMYLSADSDASVKITCPVVYSDTGISADDRVKGNPDGFSIILGSSATADSSLIVSQLVEQLGGSGYVTNQNSLKKISDKVDTLDNYDDTALTAKVDASLKAADYVAPDNTKIADIKTKVDTLQNYDDAALTAKVDASLKAADYVAPDNTKIAQIKTKVDTLDNYDDTALTAKVDATLKAVDYVAPDNAKIAQIKSIVEDKTGYSLTSAQVEAIAVAVERHLLDEGDGEMLLNAIAQAIGNENIDQIALVAAIRADMERSGGKITQIQTKVGTLQNYNDTALTAKVDATLKAADYVAPDNAKIGQIKTKVDTLVNYDDTALEAKVDATLKAADYVIPDNDTVTIINTKLDELAGDEYDPATDSLKKIKGGLSVVNNGVKKASLEIPHTDSI